MLNRFRHIHKSEDANNEHSGNDDEMWEFHNNNLRVSGLLNKGLNV